MGTGRTENLQDQSQRTKEEQRKIAQAGGIASGIARRKKKTMADALRMLLYDGKLNEQTKQMMKAEGIDDSDMTHQMVITRSLIAKAEAGDVQAYNTICSMIGEKPADKLDIGGVPTNLTIKMVGDGGDIFPSREDDIDMEKVDYSEHDGE